MPDFRSQRQIPTQAIIDAYGRSPQADMINTGMAGIEKGMAFAENMRAVREKRERAKQMAEIMQSPEVDNILGKIERNSGIPKAILKQGAISDPNKFFDIAAEFKVKSTPPPTTSNVNLQASGGIAGIDTLFGGGQPAVNPTPSAPEGYYAKELGKDLKPTKYVKTPEPKIEKTIEEKAAEAAAIAAAKEKAVRTAEQKNAIIVTKQVKENIKELEGLAKKLKGGWAGWGEEKLGQASRGKFQKEYLEYERFRPAYAVSLYRALTGDTRLSDADAAARALPLLWDAKIDERLRQPMFDRVKRALWEREQMLNQGVNNAPENTNLGELQKILNPVQPFPGGQPQTKSGFAVISEEKE